VGISRIIILRRSNVNAKEKYICGTCKYYEDCLSASAPIDKIKETDTCDDWTDTDEPELTEEERYDGGVMSKKKVSEAEDFISDEDMPE